MKNLHTALCILSLVCVVSISSAQFTITQANTPAFGTSHSFYGTDDNIEVNVGPSGANQTWTVPQIDAPLTGSNTLVQPSSTPFFDSFSTATHAFYSLDEEGTGEGYSYIRIASNGAYGLGLATMASPDDIVIIYEDESLSTPFPATYGTQWTTVIRYSSVPFPGITMTTTDSTVSHIDGWGTLNTQFGTSAVLRVFSHEFIMNDTEIPPLPPTHTEMPFYVYEWLNQSGIPLVTMWSEMNETEPNFTFGGVSFSVAGTVSTDPIRGPVADNFSVGQNYPNPFNPTTSLPISFEKAGNVEIIIYNELGEIVSSESRSLSVGNHTVGFDGSSWASGNYFAQVKADGQMQTKRMTLVK